MSDALLNAALSAAALMLAGIGILYIAQGDSRGLTLLFVAFVGSRCAT